MNGLSFKNALRIASAQKGIILIFGFFLGYPILWQTISSKWLNQGYDNFNSALFFMAILFSTYFYQFFVGRGQYIQKFSKYSQVHEFFLTRAFNRIDHYAAISLATVASLVVLVLILVGWMICYPDLKISAGNHPEVYLDLFKGSYLEATEHGGKYLAIPHGTVNVSFAYLIWIVVILSLSKMTSFFSSEKDLHYAINQFFFR